MGTDMIVGTIGVTLGLLTLALSLIILPIQIRQLRQYKTVTPYRWALLIINLAAIITVLSPIWGAIELLTVGKVSDLIRIISSASVRLFFLIVVIALFLGHTVFNKREP